MPDAVTINDSNYHEFLSPIVDGIRMGTGYLGMWPKPPSRPKYFGDIGIPLIPEDEFVSRIRDQEQSRSNWYHVSIDNDIPCKNQASTNYCWINAPVHCAELIRFLQMMVYQSYSPASAGARIKNFRNVGGWGSEGLKWMIQHGVNLSSDWPDNAIQRSYDTPQSQEKALENRIVEFFILKTWQEIVSCILALIPVAGGYNWWSHEVTLTHLREDMALGIRNSWGMSWGDKGFGWLEGGRRIPDDAVAIVSLQPS